MKMQRLIPPKLPQLTVLLMVLSTLMPGDSILQVQAFKRKYSDIYALSSDQTKNGKSYEMTEGNALNICSCDVTKGSCDAYCCCDTADCDAQVISFWNDNYNDYCAKNHIYQRYKSKYNACIDKALLRKTNPVDGMTVIERNTQTCVEVNVPSAFSIFKSEVQASSLVPEQAQIETDYLEMTIAQDTYNARKYDDYTAYYSRGD